MGLKSPDPDFPHTSQILRLASCFIRLFTVPESASKRSNIHETIILLGHCTPVISVTLGINTLYGHKQPTPGSCPVALESFILSTIGLGFACHRRYVLPGVPVQSVLQFGHICRVFLFSLFGTVPNLLASLCVITSGFL